MRNYVFVALVLDDMMDVIVDIDSMLLVDVESIHVLVMRYFGLVILLETPCELGVLAELHDLAAILKDLPHDHG